MRKNKHTLLLCGASAALIMMFEGTAFAQSSDIPQLQPKKENCEEGIKKDQIKYSNFVLITGGSLEASYNDNIYRTPSNETDDIITSVKPEAIIKSNWNKHSVRFATNAELGHYLSKNDNDYTDFGAKLSGRYDTSDLNRINLFASYRYEHSGIGANIDEPDSTLKEPVIYDDIALGVSFNGDIDKLHSYDFGATSEWFDYQNTALRDGTTSIYDDKDHRETWITGKLARKITAVTSLFAKIGHLLMSYDNMIDSTATIGHNSKGRLAVIGLEGSLPWMDWSLSGGYRGQNYDNNALPDIKTTAFNFSTNLALTKTSSASLFIDRDIKDSISTGVSGFVETKTKIAYDLVLNPKWSAQIAAEYAVNDFKSDVTLSGLDREDKIFEPSATLTYDINEQAKLNLGYSYKDRSSNRVNADYNANIITIGIKAKY